MVIDCGSKLPTGREYLLQQIRYAQRLRAKGFPGEEKQKEPHTRHPARTNKSHRQTVITRNCFAKGQMRKRGYLQFYCSHGNETYIFGRARKNDVIFVILEDMGKVRREGRGIFFCQF